MNRERLEHLRSVYRDGLLEDTLPWWIRHSVDHEHGGFLFCLDRDGRLLDDDKGMWPTARFTWLLGVLHEEVEPRAEWRDLCRHGASFLQAHGLGADGRMWFQLTRSGRPLRKRRYFFTEGFTAQALAAWARVGGDGEAAQEAWRLFRLYAEEGPVDPRWPPKVEATRPMRSLGHPMIGIGLAQEMRRLLPDQEDACTLLIDRWAAEIRSLHLSEEHQAVLEVVGAEGEVLDHFEGRTLNPGHALEGAWFLLREARERGPGDPESPALVETACRMLEWSWARGWDGENGGLLAFCDLHGGPVQEPGHDLKYWWPHNEAILATLMAYAVTGESRYASWHAQVHDWAHAHFPDPGHGEWFGSLHHDGSVASTLKGSLWKGPFHLPRMQLLCWQLTGELLLRLDRGEDGARPGSDR